jgi:hypothetical protein
MLFSTFTFSLRMSSASRDTWAIKQQQQQQQQQQPNHNVISEKVQGLPASMAQYRMTTAGTAQHSAAQRSAAQHSTAQHSTAQRSTAQRSNLTWIESSSPLLTLLLLWLQRVP